MNHASWIAAALGLVMWLPATIASAAERAEENSSEFVEALVPVEVLPPDPATANGEVRGFGLRWNAIVIAAQPARVLRAVMAGEPGAFIRKNTVLNFTVLGPVKSDATGRLAIDDDRTRSAWCEDDSRQHATIHCFQDLDGDGKLDTVRSGVLPKLDALSVNRVGSPQPVAPFSYREAGTEELPGALLQYISCPAGRTSAGGLRRTDPRDDQIRQMGQALRDAVDQDRLPER